MDLTKAINDYINNSNADYAILINGEWGSGKTYFIKSNVVNKYDNSLYVSLYGISSIDTLSEKIYLEIVKSKASTNFLSNFFKKLYKKLIFKIIFFIPIFLYELLKLLYKMFFKLLWVITYNIVNLKFDINISLLTKKDFYGILKVFKKLNKYILIIDDLERCNIPVEEIMGYLNDFVEHNKMKCIIIANEDEIFKVQSENYELKILTAINDSIEFYDCDIEPNKYSKKQAGKVDAIDIKNRINYLYNENNKYKIIKEKLIGKEFKFIPKVNDVYDNFAIKYKNDSEFYDLLMETKETVINVMNSNNFNNLRTLGFYFDNFYQIYKYSKTLVEKCCISAEFIYTNICLSLINSCISIKQGYGINYLPSDKKYDYISYKEEKYTLLPTNMYLNFDFVNEYLLNNYIERSNIEETLKEFALSNCDKLSKDDPFNLLNEYWFYTSNEITNILQEMYNRIEANLYSPGLYRLILMKVSSLVAIGFNNPITDKVVSLIKNKVEDGDVINCSEFEFFSNDKDSKIYEEYMEDIKNILNKTDEINKHETLENIFADKEWGVEFYNYIISIKAQTLRDKKFFSSLDNNKLIKKLFSSSIKDVYYFKYSLDSIYGFSNIKDYYIDDLPYLKKFKLLLDKELKKKNIDDPMLIYPLEILKEKLDGVIKHLEA